MIDEDGVEIRRGILWKKDVTIPYDRNRMWIYIEVPSNRS